MAKLLLALAVAWFGWWLWQGPKKVWTDGRRKPQRSEDEISALAVLGLDPGASRDEIRVAHRRLLRNVHPDHGGTDELAAADGCRGAAIRVRERGGHEFAP